MGKGKKKFKFNRMFGLRLSDRLDRTFYFILILTALFFTLLILRLATLNYNVYKQKAEKEIGFKYKEFISRLIINEVKKVEPGINNIRQVVIPPAVTIVHNRPAAPFISPSERKRQREKLAERIRKERSLLNQTRMIGKKGTVPAIASQLPGGLNAFSDDEDITTDTRLLVLADAQEALKRIEARARPINPLYQAEITQVTNFDPGDLTSGDVKLFNYVVERKGAAYLDVPEQLIKEPPSRQGYRDPAEIEEVVRRYSPMIDYCFRKHTRYLPNAKGFIKVAFKISYEGYVIPESVRILSSSIKNKPLEECIKRYIRYWRDFKRLDPSMGIAQVVQKFVFN